MSDEELESAPEGGDGEGTETAEKSGFAASVGKVFSTLTTFLIVVLLGFMVYATAAAARGKIVTVFGHCLLTVITGSMEPTLHVGDFIFVEKTDPAALREGDIIAFWSEQQDIYGMLVTHRIVKVTENGFVTRGDANPVDDSVEVAPGRILGRYTGKARLFRWASSFGDLRKLMLLIVMIGTTIAAFYEVRTIGRLKHKIDEEKQSKEEEREQLIREAIEREKERLAAEGFGAVPAAEPSEDAEIPAEAEESAEESTAEEAETPAEAEESSNESAAEKAETPAEAEESSNESAAEKAETPEEAEESAEESTAEEAEIPAEAEESAEESTAEEAETPAEAEESSNESAAEEAETLAEAEESAEESTTEETDTPAESEESSNESAAEEAETPAEAEESSNESTAEEAETPAEAEESSNESTAEEAEIHAEAEESAEESTAEETERPAAKSDNGGAGKSAGGNSGGSKKKKKKHKRKKHK